MVLSDRLILVIFLSFYLLDTIMIFADSMIDMAKVVYYLVNVKAFLTVKMELIFLFFSVRITL